MSQYDIRVKLDPSGVVQGRAKVEQELRGLDATAAKTTASVDGLSTGSRTLAAAQTDLMRKMSETAGAIDREGKATDSNTKAKREQERAARSAAAAEREMETALGRVLRTVDAESAAVRENNRLLADATRLRDAGKLSHENFNKVQTLVTQGSQGVTRSLGQQRAGYTQLGYQVQDITSTLALGISPLVVLAQQAGQTASAVTLAVGEKGALGKAASFIAGPYGSILIAATAILGTYAIKYLSTGSAIEEATDKLKKDHEQTQVNATAKAAYGNTLEGVTEALKRNANALRDTLEASKGQARNDAVHAQAEVLHIERLKTLTAATIAAAEAQIELNDARNRVAGNDPRITGPLNAENDAARQRLAAAKTDLSGFDRLLVNARTQADEALGLAIQERVDKTSDAVGRLHLKYDRLEASTRAASTAQEKQNGVLQEKLRVLAKLEAAEVKAAQAAERATKASDGVARFRSQQQAIGIAGREAQSRGLDVSGNNQFRPTTGHANDADHNRNAIDINESANPGKSTGGITEANVPALKAKFDALARSYQARGYNVLWNGQVWPAGGSGPSGPIKGADKHYDHIHLYAPATIVGKDTQASTFAQESREESAAERAAKAAATTVEQKSDFVSGVENQAASRGLPSDRKTQLAGKIDSTLAEYKRRFNEAASPAETKRITGALTDADAREQAEHFRTAYVEPLDALASSLGATGLQREIDLKILAETTKKGSELSAVERAQIESSVLLGDQYQREQAILEQLAAPLENYKQTIAALTDLLAKGSISQSEFNARISEMNVDSLAGLQGLDGGFDQIEKEAEEQARYDRETATFENHKAQLLALGINYDALIEAAHRRHVDNLNNIDLARKQLAIGAAANIANSLLSIAESAAGRQSAVYKAMFAVSKAFAIADSIVQIQAALAKALNAPFPQNLVQFGIVAAQAAAIVSNIQSVAANFADGGMVRGPGTSRSDSIPANLSAGEYVVNARAVSRPGNLALLDAVNSGEATHGLRRATADRTASSISPGGDSVSLSFGDVVVQTGAGTTAADGEEIGQDVRRALSQLVDERIATLQRPGGRLTRNRQSVMG